ncbi:hypothetical protein ISF_09552 [Cordyceps fumosorosea ARSEF 2679]|uniref:Uncharacterized protein n=1 Tax=Cordyceps fumosorosea (strain ARSEF 2679) TaxID=1081104 RepID=A0A167GBS0_CORFA|nr:hypothetical protein ISF_09552 [Cordyceps fumosorosea ARSEF 2679]OAA46419.1 hypothetical protein ISF_09552 [Cordyceps fumosorosea ARSEF 2679]
MVYQETEWVAYMTPTTKDTRRNFWKGKNFAGTIDWAVDLMSYHSDDGSFGHGEDWSDEFEGGTISPEAVANGAQNTVKEFMYKNASEFFTCQRSDEPDKDNLIRSSTRWTLKEGKSDAFYAALLAGTAVSSDKIVWEDVRWHDADGSPSYHGGEPMYMDFNFPNPIY